MQQPTILITGGAGFIGSALCRHLIGQNLAQVVNLDALTYAANLSSLKPIENSPNYRFHHADICDAQQLSEIIQQTQPQGIIHLAAESHVDRSINNAHTFLETNIIGTANLLQSTLQYWQQLPPTAQQTFRLLHVSTDEVYGSLGPEGLFHETTPYDPSSPYSASKAASDHLVTAWHRTYGLPCLISNCSNNYGPYHFPEKLIPLIILNALHHKPLPIYGDGSNIRDWLYVEDHARALWTIYQHGTLGEKYNVGGRNERTNLQVVQTICQLMDELAPTPPPGGHSSLIQFVTDRPGHDHRYAIDATKLETQLHWQAQETFDTGIRKTVQWYLANQNWWQPILDHKYQDQRLGNPTMTNNLLIR